MTDISITTRIPTGQRQTSGLLIYRRGLGVELGSIKNKSSQWSGQDLNLGPPDCKSSVLTVWSLPTWSYPQLTCVQTGPSPIFPEGRGDLYTGYP